MAGVLPAVVVQCFALAPADATWFSEQITALPNGGTRPNLHNGQIAFEGNNYSGIYFWDGTYVSGSPSPPTQISSSGAVARLYNGVVVYNGGSQVYYWDGTGSAQAILSGRWPDIYEGNIAYVTSGNGFDVKLWDGTTSRTIASTSLQEREPRIWGNQIAYAASVTVNVDMDIYLWDNGTTHKITNDPGLIEAGHSIYDGQLAWCGEDGNDFEIFYRSDALDPGTEVQLTANDFDDVNTSVWRGRVAWQAWDGDDWEIMYWNGISIEQVTDNDLDDTEPSLDGGMIVYASWFDGTPQIMLARIPEPSAITIVCLGVVAFLRRRRRQ
jgi:hypothetical protein